MGSVAAGTPVKQFKNTQLVGGGPGTDWIALQFPTPGTQMLWHSSSDAPPPPVCAQLMVQPVQRETQEPAGPASDAVGAALADGAADGCDCELGDTEADAVADGESVPAGGALR